MSVTQLPPAENEWLAGQTPALVLRTGTTTDVGRWFGGGRVWVACVPEKVALFAPGKTPYRELVDVAKLERSFYNVLTGELAFAPATPAVRRVGLTPGEAQQVLKHINRKEDNHA